jgi:chromosome segregation ATPase
LRYKFVTKLEQKTEFAEKESDVRDKTRKLEQKVGELNDELNQLNGVLKKLQAGELEELQDKLSGVLEVHLRDILELYGSYTEACRCAEDFLEQRDPEDHLTNREAGINRSASKEFQ